MRVWRRGYKQTSLGSVELKVRRWFLQDKPEPLIYYCVL
jgi:hypothetical protein